MSEYEQTGRCICGQVHFRVDHEPSFACHCHCESCRKASGAPYVTWVTFPIASFHVTKGAVEEHESSAGVIRGHCPTCGTTISYVHQGDRPEEIDITAPCFDDQSFVEPKAHIWLEDKPHWVEIADDLPQYAQRVSS